MGVGKVAGFDAEFRSLLSACQQYLPISSDFYRFSKSVFSFYNFTVCKTKFKPLTQNESHTYMTIADCNYTVFVGAGITLRPKQSTAVKRPKRFSFYLVGFYSMLSGTWARMYKIVNVTIFSLFSK